MTFLSPERLWLLIAVVVLAVVYVLAQRRRTEYAVRFTNLALLGTVAPKRPGWRRHAVAGVFLLAITVFIGAFAEPAREEEVPRERATIIMAIDTSLSMEATDVAPNRLDAAKAAALDFVDILPEKINLGLVTFNGNAILRVPPGTDRDAVRLAIGEEQLPARVHQVDEAVQVVAEHRGQEAVPEGLHQFLRGGFADGGNSLQGAQHGRGLIVAGQ